MEIRFEETTRGTGMVFTRVIVEGAPDGVTLEASNATLAGNPLPAEIYPIERYGGHVVCVPVFSIPQRLTVRVKDTQGDVVASTQRVVRPLSAKLSSQINTALRNEVALFIRNSNRRVRSSLTSIKVNNVIQGTKKESIVQGTISIFSTDEKALTEPVTLEALGADARSVALAPVIIMSDETDADSNYPGSLQPYHSVLGAH